MPDLSRSRPGKWPILRMGNDFVHLSSGEMWVFRTEGKFGNVDINGDQLKRSVDKFCCCVAILSTVCTATQENHAKTLRRGRKTGRCDQLSIATQGNQFKTLRR